MDRHAADDAQKENSAAAGAERGHAKETNHNADHQRTDNEEKIEAQASTLMITMTVCLIEPSAVNTQSSSPAGDAEALSGPAGTQPMVSGSSIAPEASIEQAVQLGMDSHTQQAWEAAAGQGMGEKEQSGEGKPGPAFAGIVPMGDQAGGEQVLADGTPVVLPPSANENFSKQDESSRVLTGTSPPSDAPSSRNVRAGMEDLPGDHADSGLMTEHRPYLEMSQTGHGQDHAMADRDDRAAGGGTEPGEPGRAHLHDDSGFGETVVAVRAEKVSEGSAARAASSLATGRMGAASVWPAGDQHPSIMQAVSLDLEPADLGPINVRIFMMDRTVHAHIRTEHMDLGQGMLSQQQQLETKLHDSGLEMGQFKVTVDQQQFSRGDAQSWLRQEGEWRFATDAPNHRRAESDTGPSTVSGPQRTPGIVSIFA
jgi:flagellar hook-length control protein FliK